MIGKSIHCGVCRRMLGTHSVAYRFHAFFASLDGVRRPDLLYLSSKGISATKGEVSGASKADRKPEEAAAAAVAVESEEDSDGPSQQDG